MRKIIILIGISLMCVNCSSKSDSNEMVELNDEIKDIINNYIIENQKFDSFILKPTNGLMNNENVVNVNGLLLGPAYPEILKTYPASLYFDISGKRLFYLTEINNFLVENSNWNINIRNEPDSIVFHNKITKDPWMLFICKSIYIYKNIDLTEINYRPDTIFVPKLLESTIHFKNTVN